MVKNPQVLSPCDVAPKASVCNYFDTGPGASWGYRVIPDFELIYIVSGYFSFAEEGGRKIRLCAGEVLCIYPGVSHLFKRENRAGPATISCMHLELLREGSFFNGDYDLEILPSVAADVSEDPEILRLFRKAADIFKGSDRFRDALLSKVCGETWVRMCGFWAGSGGDGRRGGRIHEMIDFLDRNISSKINRRQLAEKFGLTPEHVNSVFKKETGLTPTEHVNRRRIGEACVLLGRGHSVKEAAAKCGFQDEFYFSRVFKKIMGAPPSAYKSKPS